MPLVIDESQEAPEGAIGALPASPPQAPTPGTEAVLKAAARQDNVAGMLWDRFITNPEPNAAPVKGFDPLASVPEGYGQFADRFLDANSPQEVQWIKSRIDQEIADKQTIARAGGWGMAATLASGATDPLTLASMAIPFAGEARLANMGRLALIAGGTSAAQEGIAQELQETRTPAESLTNIASSTILGGVLGAAIRARVPAREFDRVSAGLDEVPARPEAQAASEPVVQTPAIEAAQPELASAAAPHAPEAPVTAADLEDTPLSGAARQQLTDAYAAAQGAKGGFDATLRDISDEIGTPHEPLTPALKSVPRAVEKVVSDYGGDASQVKDLLRGTIVADSQDQAEQALALARARFGEPLNLRDSLTSDAAPVGADGYRDIKFNVRNGDHLAEVQINVPEMLEAKREAHPLYEQQRSIEAQATAAGRRLTPPERARSEALLGQQRELYAAAWDRFLTRDRNAASESNVPLRPNDESGNGRPLGRSQAVQDLPGTRETGTPSTSANSVPGGNEVGRDIATTSRPSIPEGAEPGPDDNIIANPEDESTSGAAAVRRTGIAGNTIVGAGRVLAKTMGKVAPGLRLLTSPSNVVRDLAQQLGESRELLAKNLEGVASPISVETKLRVWQGLGYLARKARGEAFRAYRERIAGTGEAALSRREFGEQVAYAMRRGDNSAIPEVTKAAADTRRIAFDPAKEELQELGGLPKDLKVQGAMSYLTRQYDVRKIRANEVDWLNRLTQGFMAQGVDRAEARDIAYRATRNVLGSERGLMDWNVLDDVVPLAGPLQERTLKLPDELLEPYLANDIDHLTDSYIRSVAPEIEFRKQFGSRDLRDQIEAVKDDYARMQERAIAQGHPELLPQLDARRDADLEDIRAMRDRLYGVFGAPKDPANFFVRAGRLLRAENFLRLGGTFTLAHFADVGNLITRYGLPNTFRVLGRLGTSLKAIPLAREEAHRMGIALDMVHNVTSAMLGDYGSQSRFLEQRIAGRLTRALTIATGETPLITAIQAAASVLSQDELLRSAEAFRAGRLTDKGQLARLAAAGIDQSMLKRIATEAAQNGRQVNGIRFGMSDTWRDQEAARAFEAAISKDSHAITLQPGVGDRPLLMSSELGKTLLQFTSFAYAASRHVLMPIVQGIPRGDVRAMSGLLATLTMGYLSYWSHQRAAGMPVENDNPERLAMEVADRSNLMGWLGQIVWPSVWQLGFKDLSRWSDRDPVETMLGPTAGTVGDIYTRRLPAKVLGNQVDPGQTFTRSDLHFLRRLVPLQNLWYARRAVNGLEDSVGDLFNLPGRSQKEIGEARQAQSQ